MVQCDDQDINTFRFPRYRRSGWIGVDLDGTLATSGPTTDPLGIGDPVPFMMARVKYWLRTGRNVKIFTARASDPLEVRRIHSWCARHQLPALPVTNQKDSSMLALWDDRAVGVKTNTGIPFLPLKLGFWHRLKIAICIIRYGGSGFKVQEHLTVGRLTREDRHHFSSLFEELA